MVVWIWQNEAQCQDFESPQGGWNRVLSQIRPLQGKIAGDFFVSVDFVFEEFGNGFGRESGLVRFLSGLFYSRGQ